MMGMPYDYNSVRYIQFDDDTTGYRFLCLQPYNESDLVIGSINNSAVGFSEG